MNKQISEQQTITITIGPLTHHGTPAQVLQSKRALKRDLDAIVRAHLGVGLRNPVVHTIVEV